MSEDFNSKNNKKNQFNLNIEDTDYKNLIIRLKEIKTTIALLEKTIFK